MPTAHQNLDGDAVLHTPRPPAGPMRRTTAMQTPIIIRPLTDAEMQRVLDVIDAADTPVQALIGGAYATFDALLADAGLSTREHFTAEEPLDPQNLKIPQAQWVKIGEALKATMNNSLSATNVLLDWMNLGPSSYVEDSR